MSNIYIQEPPCKGKVCLKTSVGDIDIELWSKEAPKACRNFVQLCMEGYYNGIAFHRLVKDFIAQGGDPTGTGHGGDSIYDGPFKDEFHSRLRYSRRGLVGCANGGAKDDNNSQFFFTLAPTPELQGKHTLFGRVVGDTLFNMLKLGDGDVNQNERPSLKHKIIGADIIVNPFPDIVPRVLPKRKDGKEKKESKSKATKNFGLLSFGDEAEEEEEAAIEVAAKSKGSKSAHDILEDERLSRVAAVSSAELNADGGPEIDEEAATAEKKKLLDRIRSKLSTSTGGADEIRKKRRKGGKDDGEVDFNRIMEDSARDSDQTKRDAMRAEIATLTREIAESRRPPKEAVAAEAEPESEAMTKYHKEKDRYMDMKALMPKSKTTVREAQTLAMLAKFKEKMQSQKKAEAAPDPQIAVKEARVKELRTQLGHEYLTEVKEHEEELFGDDWMANKFELDMEELRRAKDANIRDVDSYSIHDPRNPMNMRRRLGIEAGEKAELSLHRELNPQQM